MQAKKDFGVKIHQILSLRESQTIQLLPSQWAECWWRRLQRAEPFQVEVVDLVRSGMMVAGLTDEKVPQINT